jgi:uncharacterized protein (DUF433 family)
LKLAESKEYTMNDRITCDPNILLGKPTIKGTRIAVELIMDRLSDGWSVEQIVAAYANLQTQDVLAAIAFTTQMLREEEFVAVGKLQASAL